MQQKEKRVHVLYLNPMHKVDNDLHGIGRLAKFFHLILQPLIVHTNGEGGQGPERGGQKGTRAQSEAVIALTLTDTLKHKTQTYIRRLTSNFFAARAVAMPHLPVALGMSLVVRNRLAAIIFTEP